MRFIRRNGRIIPINDKVRRVIKGAAKDALSTGVSSALLNHVLLKAPVRTSVRAGLMYGSVIGALSLGIRTVQTTRRALKKRHA